MAHTFTLVSDHARLDAIQFLERAARVNNGAARVIALDDALLMYVAVLTPRGLLDRTPTVLGLRVGALATPASFDVIVPLESLIHRLKVTGEGGNLETTVPAESPSVSWSSISPPQGGWRRRLSVSGQSLKEAAERGIAQVSEAIPDSVGESVLQKVRAEIWGAIIPGHKRIPAGAAFAAEALGFLGERSLAVHTVDNWVRVSSRGGHVLVRYPGGTGFDDKD